MTDFTAASESTASAGLGAEVLWAMLAQWPGAALLFDARARLQWCSGAARALAAAAGPELRGLSIDQLGLPWPLRPEHVSAALAGMPQQLDGGAGGAEAGAPAAWRIGLQRIDAGAGEAAVLCTAEPAGEAGRGGPADEREQGFAAAQAGIWRWDPLSGEAAADEAWCRRHQLEPCSGVDHLQRWIEQIHPDDAADYRRRLDAVRSGASADLEAEYRILTRDNRWLWILQRGRVVARGDGQAPARVTGICIDIDQRKREETESKANESRLATALWGARAAFWQWHLPTGARTLSPMWYAMTRYTREQWDSIRDPWLSRVHAEDRPAVEAAVRAYAAGATDSLEYEYRLMTAGGAWKWVLDRARAVEWELEGQPAVIMGVSLDIDAQKRAEMELRDSQTRLQTAVWGARMGLWEIDFERDHARWLDRWCEEYDIDPCEGAGHVERWTARIHPGDVDGAVQRFEAHLAGRQDYYDFEYRVMSRSGAWRWVFERARVTQRDEQGRPRRMVGVCMDVDARRQQQQQQHFTQPWLEAALSVGRGGMWHWQVGAHEVTCTDSYYRLFGVDPHAGRAEPRFWHAHVHPDDLPRVRQIALDTAAGRTQTYEAEYRMRCADGRWLWVLDRACALVRDAHGQALRMAGFVIDITERRTEREALRASEERFRYATEAARGMIYEVNYASWGAQLFGSETLLGYRSEEIGTSREQWLALLHPDDLRVFLAARPLDSSRGHAQVLEYRVRHKAGHWVRVCDRGITVAEGSGRPLRRIGFVQAAGEAAGEDARADAEPDEALPLTAF